MASVGVFSAVVQAESVVKDVEQQMYSQDDSSSAVNDNERQESINSAERDKQVYQLARTFTQRSVRHGEGGDYVNPFFGSEDPLLDPASGKFNARAWVKTMIGIKSRDPERYPERVAGVSFKNLSVHGFGTPTDYQKSFGNVPLELFSLIDKVRGRGKTKIQILRDFDGLVKSGEMLVVLGRPGRYASPQFLDVTG
jgi:ATP-binding cassette subfamily G (WHITE) protein 2 (PDR)